MSTKKAFVLLSGGLDSTTCLFKAIHDYAPDDWGASPSAREFIAGVAGRYALNHVEAVSIDYGQRHKKETEYARRTCEKLKINHVILSIGDLLKSPNTMLTEPDIQIPNVSYAELPHGVSPTYVPNRNMVMLGILTAHAQKWITEQDKLQEETGLLSADEKDTDLQKPQAGIYFGAHAEDAQNYAYPDCTPEFIGSMTAAIHMATYYQVRLYAPLMSLMKSEIVELGNKLGVPFEDTWSCYKGDEEHCGICPTCRSRKDAFRIANVSDPTKYAT